MAKRDVTDWTQKDKQQVLRPSGPRKVKDTVCKAGLLACAAAIVAVLAKGVRDSDYYD